MCNCKNKSGFKEKILEITRINQKTGIVHVVFTIGDNVYSCKESDLKDEFGICCYFLANGQEVIYIKKSTNEIIINNS